jgi:aubergine
LLYISIISGGNGNGDGDANRGAMRGRRVVHDIVRTRPENRNTKVGSMGTVTMLKANYFRLNKSPQWHIYQYRVDFAPEVEQMIVRKGLIGVHKQQLGGYLFDGTMVFLTKRLNNEVTELYSTRKDGEQIRITIKFVGEISMTDGTSLQILNLILRRAMEGLKLQLVGRNFFDAVAKTDLRECRLQLWPGYQTSIRQHEEHILVCCEITHKVMRCSTVLDILRECSSNTKDFRTAFSQQMIGQVVLTDYNNKTYRIDDVDFDSSPQSTFPTRDGDVSYIEYYKKKYNINIRDPRQPMLISRAKARDLRGGQNELMALVPELCRSTGLTDAMRNDFRLMRSLSDYTRLPPGPRIEELLKFNRRLRSTNESIQVLNDWNMDLDPNLVEFSGRVLAKQKLKFGNNRDHTADENADWGQAFRSTPMLMTENLNNWFVITSTKAAREAEQFVQQLIQVGRGMQFQIRSPRSIVIDDDRAGAYIRAIESVSNQDPQLIMCILPTNNADR